MNWRNLAVRWVAHVLDEVGEREAAQQLLAIDVPLADSGGFRLATSTGSSLDVGNCIYQDSNRALADYRVLAELSRAGMTVARRVSIVFEIPLGVDGSLPEWLAESRGADRPGAVKP